MTIAEIQDVLSKMNQEKSKKYDRLSDLSNIPCNWLYSGIDNIDTISYENARDLINRLNIVDYDLFMTFEGGVQFSFKKQDSEIFIELEIKENNFSASINNSNVIVLNDINSVINFIEHHLL